MTSEPPAVLVDRSEGEEVRFRAEGLDGWVAAEVDDVRISDGYVGVTVIEEGYKGRICDLETHHDHRVGWATPRVFRRDYEEPRTAFVDEGVLEELEAVTLGVNPDRLLPGDTLEHVSGGRYRVIVPPAEREYDNKVLAYQLDGHNNVAEKIDPSELLAGTLARVPRGDSGV